MNFEELNTQLEAVNAELRTIADNLEDANVEEAEARTSELLENRENILKQIEEAKAEAEARAKTKEELLAGKGEVIENLEERDKTMTNAEIINSEAYIEAYARGAKTNDYTECRALLTENATSGTVPVPTYLEEKIRTAWDEDEILSKVKRTEFAGNVKVGVELSATAAGIHKEGKTSGTGTVSEETLTLYIAELVPETIKKWIRVSDEVIDANGRAFLDYIFAEIEHQLVKKGADIIVDDIVSLATSGTSAPLRTDVVTEGASDIVKAFAGLSDEAREPVIIMNKSTFAYYKTLAMEANYAIDPFMGLPVLFNDSLADVTGDDGDVSVIVGDLSGVQANFPAGYAPTFKYDDTSEAEIDLVKIVGRLPMGHAVVATKFFATVSQEESA